ncbi:MAG: TonB-dependent receptor, partial [Ignavibacteriota bacterium]
VVVNAESPLLKTENAEQSVNVTGERINNLPMNFGGGGNSTGQIRNWLSFIVLSPGVSGQDESASLNGSPNNSFKIYLEGQDVTSSNDVLWESSVGAASVETIGEFSLQTSNYSAEFGQINGGLFNFTVKSGTNQCMAAPTSTSPMKRWTHPRRSPKPSPVAARTIRGTIGGTGLYPPCLRWPQQDIFFFNLELFRNKTMTAGGYSTVPTTAYRNGDFSAALTGRVLTSTLDPLGRPIVENVIYDPGTGRTVNGYVVRDPFPGNIIPSVRLDPVAVKIQNLIPKPSNSNLVNNWQQVYPGHRFQDIPAVKIDHNFSTSSHASVYYSKEHTDTIYWDEGLPIPLTGRKDQPIDGHTARVNFDKTISPTLLAHLGVGFFRLHNVDSSPAGVLNYDAAGQLGFVGSATTPGGFPRIQGLSASMGGMALSMGPVNANNYWDSKSTAVASVTWVRDNHTFKAGGEFKLESWTDRGKRGSQGVLTFSGTETGLPSTQGMSLGGGSVGFPYASFLLGTMDSAYVQAPQDPQWRKKAFSTYIQDTWKVTRRITLDYGVRYDHPSQGHEIWWRDSEFSPAVANPAVGGLLGGMAYEGYGPGRCNCTFVHNYQYGIGPRIGVAYQIDPKMVFRGGIGVTYGALPEYYYMTNGALLGLGANQLNFTNPAYGGGAATLSGGLHYNESDLYVASLDPGIRPSAGKLDAPGAGFDRNGGRPPRVLQWNLSLQREIARNLVFETAYVGNRGVWLEGDNLNNPNAISASRLKAFGLDMTNAADRTLLTSRIDSPLAASRGFHKPYSGFPDSATVAQSLRPFPQFSSSMTPTWAPLADSWYDSLQTKLTKRVSHGLDLSAAFTFQKELDSGAGGYTGARGGGVNDVFNRPNQKGLSSNSQPFILVIGYSYETPKITSNKLVRQVVGGWTTSGILRYASGGLIGVPSSNNALSSLVYQSTRMNRVPGQPLYIKNPNSGEIDPNKDFVLNPAAWTDAPAGSWGYSSAYYNDYRWQHADSEQMSFGRTFRLREKMSFMIRAEFFNVFNRLYLPNPTSNNPFQTQSRNSAGVPSAGFGRIDATAAGSQRNGQLVTRFQF